MNRLDHNLIAAKKVCSLIYDKTSPPFQTLNKPTHSTMQFRPKDMHSTDFQITDHFNDGVAIGLCPTHLSWKGIPLEHHRIIAAIKNQTNQKFKYEKDCLINSRVINFSNRTKELEYINGLLIHRINFTSMKSFKAGNCGELVSYVTMIFLTGNNLLQPEFNLEVIELTSDYFNNGGKSPYIHIIGVIDRQSASDINDPSSWGKDAVIYDPWNMGSHFSINEMLSLPYYKYGKWKFKVMYSLKPPTMKDISDRLFITKFNSLERYILEIPLPENKLVAYINQALNVLD